LRHRIRKGTPHAVIGGGKREVSAIDEVTGLGVGDNPPCPDTFSCCPEYKLELTGSVEASYLTNTDIKSIELTNINRIVQFVTHPYEERGWIVDGTAIGEVVIINYEEKVTQFLCPYTSPTCLCPEDISFVGKCENVSMSCYKEETDSELSTGAIIAISASAVVLVLLGFSYKKCRKNADTFEGNLL